MHVVSIRTLLNFLHKLCQLGMSSAAVVNLSEEGREHAREEGGGGCQEEGVRGGGGSNIRRE